jgi:hypothetical protein
MCTSMFQDSVLSISKARNLRWYTSVILLLLQEINVLVVAVFFVINCMQWVFEKLIDKFDLNQLSTVLIFTLSLVSKLSGLLTVTIKLVSSAKRIGIADSSMAKGRSLIYSKNNNDPCVEPCGMPCRILNQLDSMLQRDTLSVKITNSSRYWEYITALKFCCYLAACFPNWQHFLFYWLTR